MKKLEYYLNVVGGIKSGKYPKVNGYAEAVTDSKGVSTLLIGYDQRNKDCWMATELNTGFCVSLGSFETRKMCRDNVHNNIDTIVDVYNKRMTDEKYYNNYIKPFEDYVGSQSNK